ncbi:AAA family ATPase, partial [bacterium]|nr:AAA family ATPase [bacterium]
MYLNFYGMVKAPFHITPDPAFLYFSDSHKEALASIIYAVDQRKGFVAITGEVGTGKTTIVRAYLEKCDRSRTNPIYVFNANLTFQELMRIMFQEMGIIPQSLEVADMVQQFHRILIEDYKVGQNTVLIIDEAQNTPVETLENLRMLSNLETNQDKLIQIVLVGQPELNEKLNRPELRQLKQRIAVRSMIRPLTTKESQAYVEHRLAQVGAQRKDVFSTGAVQRMASHSGGAPRLLNILADNALISGYALQKRPVGRGIVREVIRDFARDEGGVSRLGARWLKVAVAAVVLIALALGVWAIGDEVRDALARKWSAVEFASDVESAEDPSMSEAGSAEASGTRGVDTLADSGATPEPISPTMDDRESTASLASEPQPEPTPAPTPEPTPTPTPEP